MIKPLIAAIALAFAPVFALAEGCSKQKHAGMSCADGTTWDADAHKCVTVSG